MVAISLYKGNLHKVSDHPRKWVMPTPKISLKDFRVLLRRRSRALSRLVAVENAVPAAAAAASSSPNPKNNNSISDDNNCNHDVQSEIPWLDEKVVVDVAVADRSKAEVDEGGAGGGDERRLEGEDCREKLGAEVVDPVAVEVNHKVDNHSVDAQNLLNEIVGNQPLKMEGDEEENETRNKEDEESDKDKRDKDKRKMEVEQKLHLLNEKKHSLVQVLKQILNAEEELKRRSSMQGMPISSSSALLHVDIPNDSGSITRLNTPRIGSDGTFIGEMGGGEPDGTSNHNTDPRHLLRMNSASPSSDFHHRRSGYNAIPHAARTTLGFIGSPSHMALAGQQGPHSNLPTVSVSGTNYVASSPSPAASGGTSAFRDSRIPSPWN